MKKSVCAVCVATIVAALGSAAMAVNIDTVIVGNIGNAADSTGYGSVSYEYNIGKYEVTAGQYTEFLNAVASTDTYGLYSTEMWSSDYGCKIERAGASGSYSYSVSALRADRPVNYVSWGDAARFANWMHNGQGSGDTEDGSYYLNGAVTAEALLAVTRESAATWALTSEDEWYKAAYHKNDGVTGNYFAYPTSNDAVPSNDLVEPDPGNNATFYDAGYSDPTLYFTEIGAYENSESPYDTFDQGGNVWEWNEAIISETRGLLGSGFAHTAAGLEAGYRSFAQAPTYETHSTGFRVAEVPEPTTMVLLGLGGLSVLIRRKK